MSGNDSATEGDDPQIGSVANGRSQGLDTTVELMLGYGRAADRMRELIDLLHSGRATQREIALLEGHLGAATAIAAGLPADRVRQIEVPDQDDEPNAEFRSTSPVSGMVNPIAPPMKFDEEQSTDTTSVAYVTFSGPYEGPPGHVHGGWVAAVLDEILGRAQRLSGQMGMTGSLDIRYRAPSPLHKELRASATLESVDGRKVTVSGVLSDGDRPLATAIGVFIHVDFDAMRRRSNKGSDSPGFPD